VRLIGSRTALAPVVVPLAGLLLHRNGLRKPSVTVPPAGLLLHRNVLRRSSVAGLGIHAKFLVQKGQLLVELASRLREFVEPSLLLMVYIRVKVQVDLQADKSPVVVKGPFFPQVVNPRYRICGTMCNARSNLISRKHFDLERGFCI
jgi:hypothetical protein